MKPYAQYIGSTDGVHHLTAANGNTKDIMNTVLLADGKAAAYCAQLAQALTGADPVQTCYNIWNFWKQNVKYVEDPDGYQFIKSPAYLYETGEGDCKSYSVAIASCLKHLGIPYAYRFITQEADKPFHHVYVVAYTNQGTVLIDCVIDYFNKENAYARKKDVRPTGANTPMPKAAAIGRANRGVHYLPNSIGATQAETVAANWQQYEADFVKGVAAKTDFLRTQAKAIVEQHYKNKPIYKKRALKLFDERWGDCLKAGSCMVYAFWDSTKAIYPTGNFLPNDPSQLYGTTTDFTGKRKTALDYYQSLKESFGLTDELIKLMAQISCYNVHGITMEYMLYRCYNMVNYGQPWEPVAGVPYYNFKTGVFVNQGNTPDSLQQTIRIALCFPAGGGITRPWGVPYWSVGGWLIQNGMDQANWDFIQKNPNNQPPRTAEIIAHTANNGAGIPASEMAVCYNTYKAWLNGNLPALPSVLTAPGGSIATPQPTPVTPGFTPPYSPPPPPPHPTPGSANGGHHVGGFRKDARIGIADVIVAAVIALVTAVVTSVVGGIFAYLNAKLRVPPPGTAIANPPPDFHMEFQTVDGCYIGAAPSECATGKAKYCPDGSFTCLTAADLAKPENQAAMPTDGFLPQGSSKWLLLAAAALFGIYFFSSSSKSNS